MKTMRFLFILLIIPCAMILTVVDESHPRRTGGERSSYRLESAVIGVAGAPATSSNHAGNGTLSQSTPIGIATGGDRVVYAGFWERLYRLPSTVEQIEGDALANLLFRNYPNPFTHITTIRYGLAREGAVEIKVFDPGGRRIRTLVDGLMPAGLHLAVWNGRDDTGSRVPSGIYFYSMKTGSFRSVMKMITLR